MLLEKYLSSNLSLGNIYLVICDGTSNLQMTADEIQGHTGKKKQTINKLTLKPSCQIYKQAIKTVH